MNVCVTKLCCEKGELKIKLSVFTNKIRDLIKDDFQSGTAQPQQPNVYKHL